MRNSVLSVVTVIGLLSCVTLSAHAGSCDAVYKAGIKSVQTPHHVFATTTHGENTIHSESIYAGGVEYGQMRGVWRRSRMTAEEMLQSAQEKLATQPDLCTGSTDESIDGHAVAVYRVRNKESGTESQVRVFKSNGMLQGQSVVLPNGDRIETRYEYENVVPPPSVH